MAMLKMDYETTKDVGNQIAQKHESFVTLLGEIKRINGDLKAVWEGADATKYTTAVAEQAQHMDELAKTIASISSFIIQAANVIEETQNANANSINAG